MFHRHNTSRVASFLKNIFSRVHASVFRIILVVRFHRFQRQHKIAILVTSIGIFSVSLLTIFFGFSGDTVFGQIRFQIAIRALPQCQNSIDDDGDTLIDFPSDPDCTGPSDTSEGIPFVPPTVTCFAPVTSGLTNQSMTWIAIPSNGNGTYTYGWSGSDSLTGTAASVNKTYTSAGTKTASVVVTSGAFSSAVTPCINTILISNPTPPSGGGGGGGGGSVIVPPPKPPVTPPTDNTDNTPPPLDAAPPGGDDDTPHADCGVPTLNSTFQDYKDYLVCDALITPRVIEEHYEYEKNTPRKELLGVAVELALKDKSQVVRDGLERFSSAKTPVLISDAGSVRPFHFFDVGLEGQPAWIAQTVQKGVVLGLISTENTLFRPDDISTRAEAFAMLMKAVCMNPDDSVYPTWEERVYATAKRYNLTVRSWKNFQAQSSVLRQELFVMTTKLDLWRDYTGGCTPKKVIKPLPPILQMTPIIVPPLASAPPAPDSSNTISKEVTQKPGTFALLYENETEEVYSYIVKSGGIPDGVRAQFIRVFGLNKSIASRLKIHDIAGTPYPEERWLLGGELVYVTLQK